MFTTEGLGITVKQTDSLYALAFTVCLCYLIFRAVYWYRGRGK